MGGKPNALYFLGLVDLGGFLRAIKKPACGRLLGGGQGLFLVSRNNL
jgi:hypothetical protein